MKGTIEKQISKNDLVSITEYIRKHGARMQMAYAWHPHNQAYPEIIYVGTMGSRKPFQVWRLPLEKSKQVPSLANLAPLLSWHEREIRDLFGIEFLHHPEPYPMVLHEGGKSTISPMSPDYPPQKILPFSFEPWQLPKFENENIQQLPFGPVRGAICESAQFTYFYAGEFILHFYQRLFFKHRGMEKRFEGLSLDLGVILAERVCGVSSVAHSLAFCQAVENACDCEVPERAKQWRVILAELERLYNHLQYLGHLCHTTTLKIGEVQGKLLEERVKQLNAKVTGSRFLREIITPGGLRKEPQAKEIESTLNVLHKDIKIYCEELLETYSHLDRLIGTGILTKKAAFEDGSTGPVLRASGIKYDFRHDHPYAAYANQQLTVPISENGDANARMSVRIMEIEESIRLIKGMLVVLRTGPIKSDCISTPYAEGLGWVESPRGALFYAIHLDGAGNLARVKINSPSFSNWRVFPSTVHESNMMDYAINEASFGLTIADCDR